MKTQERNKLFLWYSVGSIGILMVICWYLPNDKFIKHIVIHAFKSYQTNNMSNDILFNHIMKTPKYVNFVYITDYISETIEHSYLQK